MRSSVCCSRLPPVMYFAPGFSKDTNFLKNLTHLNNGFWGKRMMPESALHCQDISCTGGTWGMRSCQFLAYVFRRESSRQDACTTLGIQKYRTWADRQISAGIVPCGAVVRRMMNPRSGVCPDGETKLLNVPVPGPGLFSSAAGATKASRRKHLC